MSKLAGTLARVLAEAALGRPAEEGERFPEGCDETTCFLRLNRYPPCPISADAFGLVPHTDSDFLTVLCQDQQVGGLQLMKGARWVAVKPIPGALIVNIGDLFQVPYAHHIDRFARCIYMLCCVSADPSVGRSIYRRRRPSYLLATVLLAAKPCIARIHPLSLNNCLYKTVFLSQIRFWATNKKKKRYGVVRAFRQSKNVLHAANEKSTSIIPPIDSSRDRKTRQDPSSPVHASYTHIATWCIAAFAREAMHL
jgi:hypothetical protein